jgi:hypothetical protein
MRCQAGASVAFARCWCGHERPGRDRHELQTRKARHGLCDLESNVRFLLCTLESHQETVCARLNVLLLARDPTAPQMNDGGQEVTAGAKEQLQGLPAKLSREKRSSHCVNRHLQISLFLPLNLTKLFPFSLSKKESTEQTVVRPAGENLLLAMKAARYSHLSSTQFQPHSTSLNLHRNGIPTAQRHVQVTFHRSQPNTMKIKQTSGLLWQVLAPPRLLLPDD